MREKAGRGRAEFKVSGGRRKIDSARQKRREEDVANALRFKEESLGGGKKD